ncbi:MAG: hypothetical protein ABSE89_11130 [Sedimentisphaerales bacterium]
MKVDWKSWKVRLIGAVGMTAMIFGLIESVEHIFCSHAKPQLLDTQNCIVRIGGNSEEVHFELLVNNIGTKDCSLISIDLTWPDGLNADIGGLGHESLTPLPKTIPAGSTERIKMSGSGHKIREEGVWEGKLELKPNQKSVEATVVVKFNTGHIIKRKIIFAVERS